MRLDLDMILPTMAGVSGVFAGCAVLYSKIRSADIVVAFCS